MRPAVFLDRDNTLIANDGDLGDPDKVSLLPGVRDGLQELEKAGYVLVVVTNQGGVARGHYGESDVARVHDRIAELVGSVQPLAFYHCPYHPEGTVPEYTREHHWRKPAPGMLLAAAEELQLDLEGSWMVGDQPRDIQAGTAAGCRTILLGGTDGDTGATLEADDFTGAVKAILDAEQRP